jgi:copper chaperone CopZ
LVIKKALEGLEGVEKARISFKAKRGEVIYDADKVTQTDIVNKVNQIGFRAEVIGE